MLYHFDLDAITHVFILGIKSFASNLMSIRQDWEHNLCFELISNAGICTCWENLFSAKPKFYVLFQTLKPEISWTGQWSRSEQTPDIGVMMPYICNAPDTFLVMSHLFNGSFAKFLVVLEGFCVFGYSLVSVSVELFLPTVWQQNRDWLGSLMLDINCLPCKFRRDVYQSIKESTYIWNHALDNSQDP